MVFNLTIIEKIGLFAGLLGIIGLVMIPFNHYVVQTHWFVFFAAFALFTSRFFISPTLRMPERIALFGFLGFLGFLGFVPGFQFLHFLFLFFGFFGFLGFLGRYGSNQRGNNKA